MSSASTGGTEGSSPASSPASAASLAMAAPKYGTLVPNRIFVGGISASTSEAELAQLFSAYGNVKATKIISDRAGVSKGYGFVTFETEEEAKRLQQESECIVLRERKLNIAPAIKKQPFNRSFDGGSGSPPAVPSNAYYYTNGMGLTYQSGMTFYNTGAPAPGTPIAPSADPATIYQAAGVFGPQPATGHQTFAPVMYPCPAPSLYMPQQYQYTPMPYDSYYAGAAAAGAPQYLYTTSSGPQSNIGSGSGGGGSGGGGGGGQGGPGIGGSNGTSSNNSGNTNINGSNSATGATSTPTVSHQQQPSSATTSGLSSVSSLGPPPPPSANHHFYSTGGPPPQGLHHPPLVTCPPAPTQIEQHLYYSFPTAGPPGPPPPPSSAHATLGLPDQQLLLYATDASTVATCQQTSADAQTSNQEVQFYAPAQQNRYQPPPPPPQHQHHHQHQAQHHHHQPPSHHQHPYQHQQQQRRYAMATSVLPTGRNKTSSSDKYTSTGSTGQTGASMLRQQQQNKYKVNGGLVQNNPGNSGTGGKASDDSLGGAGDASSNSVGRLPITPPATPRGHHANHSNHPAGGDQNQLTDACHQMQALTL